MDAIAKIRQKARGRLRTIALPEYNDPRVKEASTIIEREGIARVLLLDPQSITPQDKERYIEEFYKMRKVKVPGLDIAIVRRLFEDTLYSAAMMTRLGEIDGFVAGACHTTPDMARAAIHCLEIDPRIGLTCSSFIMAVPECRFGDEGTFVFADCGIIPEPTSQQLVSIAMASAELAHMVLDLVPRVALLSYSTKGSARDKVVEKITGALDLLKAKAPDLLVDGELQVDAAIVPEVARMKYPDSVLGGQANVLVFPNLEAGNISYKLVERLGKARALGPLIMGMTKPCSDLSRGCSVEDVVDVVAVTAVRAQQ